MKNKEKKGQMLYIAVEQSQGCI